MRIIGIEEIIFGFVLLVVQCKVVNTYQATELYKISTITDISLALPLYYTIVQSYITNLYMHMIYQKVRTFACCKY